MGTAHLPQPYVLHNEQARPHVWRGVGFGGGSLCTVGSNVLWVMVTCDPPCRQNDTQTRLKALPSRNFIGGW